jgi:hypothetical protein
VHINGRNYNGGSRAPQRRRRSRLKLHSFHTAENANWFTEKYCGERTFTEDEMARIERDYRERIAKGEVDDENHDNGAQIERI